MKKTFTILIAAIAAILMMAQPKMVSGQSKDLVQVVSFSRSNGTDTYTSGQTLTKAVQNKNGIYQDGSNDPAYLQLKGSSAYWTTTPSSISFTANLGGGTTKDPLDNNVYVVLIDSDGNEISGTATIVTTKITSTNGSDFTVSVPVANNVYGVKIRHAKDTGYNVRYFSFSLSYEAAPSGPTQLSAPTLTATPDNGKVTLEWAAVSNASSYTIQYADNSSFTGATTVTNATSPKEITGLTNGTTYYFKAMSVGDGTNYTSSDYGTAVSATPANITKITITQDNLTGFTNSYNWYDWTAGGVSGKAYAFKNSGMQFNSSKDAYWIYNSSAIPGTITSVKMVKASGTDRSWTLRAGTSEISTTDGGTQVGDAQTVGTSGATWDVTGSNNYFCLIVSGGSTVISSIEITYIPSTDPIIVASDPEALAYNAAGGEFGYSITNPTSATLSAVSNADWITNVAVDGTNSKVTFSTSINTGAQRQGTITLSYTGANDKVITVTQNAAPAPSINAEDVNIAGDATLGSITYTISNPVSGGVLTASTTSTWLTPGVVTNEAVPFTCEANQGAARSATVELTYTYNTNQTVTKNVTVTQATAPYTTIPALFAAATSSNKTVDVTFNNWVVSGVSTNGKNVFVTDNQGNGFVINSSTDQSGTYAVGNILSGTASSCTLKLNNGYAQLTNVSGLTINTGGTVTVSNIALADLSGVHTGALVSYNNLACSVSNTTYTLTDGATTIQLYTSLYNYTTTPDLVNGKTYDITGIYQQYSGTKEILPRSAADIEIKADLDTDTDFSGLTAFAYVLGHGPSEAQTVDIYCYDLEENTLTATAPANFEVSLTGDDDDYSPSVAMTPDDGDVSETLYIRLAAGKDAGDYGGNLVFTAANLDTKNVALTGSVTTNPTYAITLVQPEQATISDNDVELAEAGTIITLSYTDLDDCYNFSDWSVYKTGEPGTTETVTNNQFEMPGYPVTVTATFTQKTYTLDYYVNGSVVGVAGWHQSGVNCGTPVTLKTASEVTEAGISMPTGYSFAGWSTAANSTTTVSSVEVTANTTLYAVLVPTGVSSDYVKITEDLEDWSGEYLIVYEDGLVAFDGSRDNSTNNKIDASSNTIDITNYLDNGVIESNNTTDAAIFTISAITGGYSIQSASGYYIGSDSHYNELDVNANTAYANSLSIDDDENAVIIGFYESSSSYTALRYNASSNQNRFRYYKEAGQQAIQLYKKQTATPYTRVFTSTTTAPADITIEGPTLIAKDAVLDMGEYILSNSNASNLIIEDGGQLILSNTNTNVAATVKKEIEKTEFPSTKDGEAPEGWYSISSSVNPTTILTNTNLVTESKFDLYYYDETASTMQWKNYHQSEGVGFTTMDRGRGYLYRNENDVTIAFTGTVNTGDITYNVTKSDVGTLSGFNLIGNPFTHDISKGSGKNIDDDKLNTGFYVATNSGAWESCSDGTIIEKNQGFLVQANTEGYITIKNTVTSKGGDKANHDNIKFMVSNTQYEDVTYAMFDKGRGLNKISHRNAEIPMLYIPQNDENYAIAMMDDNTQAFNLSFKAMTMGKYTLSYKAKGEFNYLHIIDRMTGEDVDMLLESEYSFVGTPSDNENRFIVRLGYKPNYNDNGEDIFAYQNGNDIVVSGEGELQVFDVMGRMISTRMINGVETVNIQTQGVYIMKLNEKTQKIVVR